MKLQAWITLIGIILLVLGIYGAGRTAVNFAVFDKYPTTGAFTLPFAGTPWGPREQDCVYMAPEPLVVYEDDTQRPPSDTETKQMKKQEELCLAGVQESRKQAMVNDISQSVLFLLLGGALLALRKSKFFA